MRTWTVVAVAIGIAMLSPHGAAAGTGTRRADAQHASLVEVTHTGFGQRLAAAASVRLSGAGTQVEGRSFRVLRDANGWLIVPRGTSVAVRPDGTVVPVARPDAGTRRIPASTAANQGWSYAGGGCYERVSDVWAWLDHCARIYRLIQDGDPQRDFYALERMATAGPNMPWVLKSATIGSSPAGSSATQAWLDWSPRGDRSGSCVPFTVRIAVPMPGISDVLDRCESWDMTKGTAGGDFQLAWSGCACAQDRELGYALSIAVPQGTLPAWYVPGEVHGFPF